MFEDWMEKYEHIITLGKELPLIDEQYKTDDNIIKGCQSKVWLHAELKDNKMNFSADSDAIITKGIIAIMVRALNNQSPADVLNADMAFVDKVGLKEHLSPTRANGLVSMIKQMKFYALAFQTKQNNG
jgi:cysteine desulfuration protein SufE